MSAFDRLEQRALNLTLGGAQDRGEQVVVIGLHKSSPAETHDGSYGQAGEPMAGGTYKRSRVTFGNATRAGDGKAQVTNLQPVTVTGLTPGTYTHFSLHGSSSAGQA